MMPSIFNPNSSANDTFPVHTTAEDLGRYLTNPEELQNALDDIQNVWEAPSNYHLLYFTYVTGQTMDLEADLAEVHLKENSIQH